jgi:hypothetical protein
VKVEDVDRYNTFQSGQGIGIFGGGSNCVIFQISEDDIPILDPVPPQVSQVSFIGQITARFANTDPAHTHRVLQPAHGFENSIGKALWVNPVTQKYEVATGLNATSMVGTIKRTIGPDIFYFVPTTKIIETITSPILPGTAGQYVYVDDTGKMVVYSGVEPPDGAKKAYLQLTNAVSDTITGFVIDGTTTSGYQTKFNNVPVTFSSGALASVVSSINSSTSSHHVTAAAVLAPSSAITNSANRVYSVVFTDGAIATATINGVLVHFNDTKHGSIAYSPSVVADSVDMANVINAANIPNITAVGGIGGSGGILTITNSSGGAITIVNGTADAQGNPFAGPGSCSGLPLSTPATVGLHLKLTNTKGTGIRLQNVTGDMIGDFGLRSVVNGAVPKGLVVEMDGGEIGGPQGTVESITIESATTALTVDNPTITSTGTVTLDLDADLTAVADISTTGIVVRTADATWETKAIDGSPGNIIVLNGDAISGNPTIDLTPITPTTGGTLQKFITDGFGRVTGVDVVITSDITALVDDTYVNISGDTMTGPLDMGDQVITNVADPVAGADAVNKAYVDSIVAGSAITVVATLKATVTLEADGEVIIGALPGNATVTRILVNVVSASSSPAITIDIDNVTASQNLMHNTWNDGSVPGLYESSCMVVGAEGDTISAVITNAAAGGSADVIVEYRLN